jgi:hypothetical protein
MRLVFYATLLVKMVNELEGGMMMASLPTHTRITLGSQSRNASDMSEESDAERYEMKYQQESLHSWN